jgi:hypothetical protein
MWHLQLLSTFPAIFDTPKTLAFARQLALQFHREARRNYRRNRSSSQRQRVDAAVGSKQGLEPSQDPIVVRTGVESPPPPHPEGKEIGNSSTGSPSKSTLSICPIHHFLKNCAPSLEHYLYRFIDLGFQSPDLLQQVADNWTADEKRSLLRRLAPANGQVITELELAAFERGFSCLKRLPE